MTKESIKIAIIALVALSSLAITVYAGEHPSILLIANDSSTHNTISDTTITEAIKSKYIADPEIKGLDIHIVTENGIVKLFGQAPNQIIEDKAINLAQDIDGIREIISNIKIKEASTVSSAISDSAISTAIKSKLLTDSRVNGLRIHINTARGIVTLDGKVPNDEMKDIAILIARNTDGVKEVTSELKVLDPRPDSYFSD